MSVYCTGSELEYLYGLIVSLRKKKWKMENGL